MQIGGVYATRINALATAYMATLKFKTYINVLLRKCLTFRDLKRRENKPVLLQNPVSFSSFQKALILFKEQARSRPCCAADQHLKAAWQSVSDFVVTGGVENVVALKRKHGGWNLLKRCSGNLFGWAAIFIWTQMDFYIEISCVLVKLSLSNWSVQSLKIEFSANCREPPPPF